MDVVDVVDGAVMVEVVDGAVVVEVVDGAVVVEVADDAVMVEVVCINIMSHGKPIQHSARKKTCSSNHGMSSSEAQV